MGYRKGTLDLDDRGGTLQEAGLDGETKLDSLLHLPATASIWLHISTIKVDCYITINATQPARCLLAPQPLITGALSTILQCLMLLLTATFVCSAL